MHSRDKLLAWLPTQIHHPTNPFTDNSRVSKPHVVAIDGYAGAGKSTLAAWLQQQLNINDITCEAICLDDFYCPITQLQQHHLSLPHSVDAYFNAQAFVANVLHPLCQGEQASWQPIDWLTGNTLPIKTASPSALLILEGVFASHPIIKPYLDTLVMVTAQSTIRHQRVADRPQPDTQWFKHWQACEDWFHTHYATQQQADWVIMGE